MSRWWPAYTASRPPGQVVPLAESPLDSGDCVTAGWGTHTIGGLVGWLPCLLVRPDAPLPTAGAWKPPPEGRRPPGGEGGVRGEAGRLPWLPDTSGGADTETYPSINMQEDGLCAGGLEGAPCFGFLWGDAGGPLACGDQLTGVVSRQQALN